MTEQIDTRGTLIAGLVAGVMLLLGRMLFGKKKRMFSGTGRFSEIHFIWRR
jgi:hypothetical protein